MRNWKKALALVWVILVIASCGSSASLIQTPAKDINLSEADLGSGFTLTTDQGLEEVKASMDLPEDKDIKDASFRMFEDAETAGVVLAMVITLNKTADSAMLGDLSDGLEEGFASELPGVELQELDPPSLGDEATITAADLGDIGFSLYFVGFRKDNVVGIIGLVGMSDFATEGKAVELGRQMLGKVK